MIKARVHLIISLPEARAEVQPVPPADATATRGAQ